MARKISKASSAKASTSTKKPDRKQQKRIPKYELLPKKMLAAYPDADGNPMYVGDRAEDAKELLDPTNLLATRSSKNSEMLDRPGWGLSFAATAANHCLKELVRQKTKPKASSVASFVTLLEKPRGKGFQEAVAALDVGKDGSVPRKDVAKAMKAYVSFLKEGGEDLQSTLVGLAVESGRFYLGAMHMLEQRAFILKPKTWAKKLQRSGRVDPALKSWLSDADNVQKLENSLVDVFMAKMKDSKAASKKWAGSEAKASDSSNSPSSKESSSTAKSSVEDKKDKKKKKKDVKKAASSVSAEDSNKKKKKSKKVKKDKKLKSADSRSRERPASPSKPAADTLKLGSSDEESEKTPSVYLEWDRKEAQAFVRDLAHCQASKEKPKSSADRLTLDGLVSLLDNIPEKILDVHGLVDVLSKLKGMGRLPKQKKLDEILARVDALCQQTQQAFVDAGQPLEESVPKASYLKIRRASGLNAEGHVTIADDDLHDEVEILKDDETVQDVLLRFFETQSSTAELENWTAKRLEGSTCEQLDAATVLAKLVPNLVLLRKGG